MTGKIEYTVMDPTGNRTILVHTIVDETKASAVAGRIMEKEPEAEQLGFLSDVERTRATIRMAGGEFCGNAAMSVAAYVNSLYGGPAEEVEVFFEGCGIGVTALASGTTEGDYQGCVRMPEVSRIEIRHLPEIGSFPVVEFPGITHVIRSGSFEAQVEECRIRNACAHLKAQALGFLFFEESEGTLCPLVYVKEANTLFFEKSCASGTAAIGAWLSDRDKRPVRRKIRQSGGTLQVTADAGGPILLEGRVRRCHNGNVTIS